MLRGLLNKLSGRVRVEISPDVFTFPKGSKSSAVGTFLYLDNTREQVRILSIGECFEGSERCVRVELFTPDSPLGEGSSRLELLAAFLRFGFQTVSGRRLFLPTVTFRGESSLNRIVCGFQRTILSEGAMLAGAYSVEFTK